MKRLLLIIAIILFPAMILSHPHGREYKKYTNEAYNYSVTIPKWWHVHGKNITIEDASEMGEESKGSKGGKEGDEEAEDVDEDEGNKGEKKEGKDKEESHIMQAIGTRNIDITVRAYKTEGADINRIAHKNRWNLRKIDPFLKKIIDTKRMKIQKKIKGKLLLFEYRLKNRSILQRTMITAKNDIVYIIECRAPMRIFHRFKEPFNIAMSSFKFNDGDGEDEDEEAISDDSDSPDTGDDDDTPKKVKKKKSKKSEE
jgi:hypothetical protein